MDLRMASNMENKKDDAQSKTKPPDLEFDIIIGALKGGVELQSDGPTANAMEVDADSFAVSNKINEDCVNGPSSMALSIGTKVEVKDFENIWSPAQILEVDYEEMEVLVHYDNIKRHDEWISVNSPRIRPYVERPAQDIYSPVVHLNDCLEMPPEPKIKQHFVVGERCLARWHNNSKFTATIHQVLENDKYEVMFDDGSTWKCKVVRLCKLKSEPSSTNTTPEPTISIDKTLATQHKHLFDPTLDYLGTKSERREKKRKLNIKALFNIGQTKRYRKSGSRKETAKETTGNNDSIMDEDVMLSDMISDTSRNNNGQLSPEPDEKFEKFDEINEDKHNETISTMKEMISKLECSLGKVTSENEDVPSPQSDTKITLPVAKTDLPVESKDIISIKTEDLTPVINIEDENIIIPIKEKVKRKDETKKTKKETSKPQQEKRKQETIKLEEETNIIEEEVINPGKINPEIVKVEEETNVIIEESPEDIAQRQLLEKRRLDKIRRMKRAKKIRQIREEKVKKEMEKVKSELEEMRKQVEEMKEQVQVKKKKPANPSELEENQWCCKWVGGQPQGVPYEKEGEGSHRYVIQVEDKRIPPSFTKLMMRRNTGFSAGKWDVVFVSPDNRRLHNKVEMKNYLELQNDPTLKPYEYALFDFAVHRRLSRNIGWDDSPKKGKGIKIKIRKQNSEVAIVKKSKSAKKKKKKHSVPKVRSPESVDFDTNSSTLEPISEEMMAKLLALQSNSLTSNYTLCGVLKAEVLCNMLRCPANNCYKNFRTIILLQMHIKYYHKDLIDLMGATPTVYDLASSNVAPEYETETKVQKTKTSKTKPKAFEEHRKDIDDNFAENDNLGLTESPKLRKALVVTKKKRPRVLLPVRDGQVPTLPDAISEIEDSEYTFQDEFEKKYGIDDVSKDLDFEAAISAHTVCRKRRGRPSKALSDDETFSDLETQSSFPRSGSPDFKGLHPIGSKEGELYYTSETGEKIKIVHMKREEIINCHCGYREEDGLMIQCELCLCWQHAICHNIHKEAEVPEKYTCSICLNPRRGRRSRRFVHDQDRLYEGLLAGAAPCPRLRRAHELTGNLLRVADSLHALRVKRHVAVTKNHPKLYLWAWEWEQEQQDKMAADFDLSAMIVDPLPLKTEDLSSLADMRMPSSDDIDEQRLSQKSEGSLSNLLSSPGGTTFDLPISTCELEKLAKAVQEPEPAPEPTTIPSAPQPDEPIDDNTSRENLYLHIQRCQAIIDARLDSIEAQVAELESQEPSGVDDETAEYFPRTKQTVTMLLRDLAAMEELGQLS